MAFLTTLLYASLEIERKNWLAGKWEGGDVREGGVMGDGLHSAILLYE